MPVVWVFLIDREICYETFGFWIIRYSTVYYPLTIDDIAVDITGEGLLFITAIVHRLE